jgi:competence protein ComEC
LILCAIIPLYFALTVEPPLWLGAAVMLAAIAAAIVARRRPVWRGAAISLALTAAGFALIGETTRERAAPMLDRRLGPVAITGNVVDIDTLDRGWRIIVAPDPLPGLDPARQPHLIRIHITEASDLLSPGDRTSFKAMLYPVPGQTVPGAHDLQREAYFAGIGAVGYSYGGARHLAEDTGAPAGWRQWLLRLRTEVTRRITAVLPGSTGGVAAALIAGKRGAIDQEVIEAFRNSGLSHLLAIAGLHLGLVGAFVFFAVRGGLTLAPYVALRLPIKKIAAAVTLVVLFCYLMLSGAAIPTERAFVMNGIVFAAILIDRLRISMRICAIAAAVVLVLRPESLAGVSFQMSFGAVVALIAVYETWGEQLAYALRRGSAARKVLGYAGGIAVTTLVVTIGTDPFSIYHFHRIALYSPLANVIAVPISALWTLPWGVVSCLLMPFGLERLALIPMGWGIDATRWFAPTAISSEGSIHFTIARRLQRSLANARLPSAVARRPGSPEPRVTDNPVSGNSAASAATLSPETDKYSSRQGQHIGRDRDGIGGNEAGHGHMRPAQTIEVQQNLLRVLNLGGQDRDRTARETHVWDERDRRHEAGL